MPNVMDRIRRGIYEFRKDHMREPVVFIDHEVKRLLREECHLIISPTDDETEEFANLMGCEVYVTEEVDGVAVRPENRDGRRR